MTHLPSRGWRKNAICCIPLSISVIRLWESAVVARTTRRRASMHIIRRSGYLHRTRRIILCLAWWPTPAFWGLSAYGEWCRWELTLLHEATGAPPSWFHELAG